MEKAESDIVNSIDVEVGTETAFALVSDASELQKWFAEDVSIDQRVAGNFTFAGNGAYQPTSTTLTRYEPGRLLAWEWPLHGVVGEVTVEVAQGEKAGSTRVNVTSRFPELPDIPRARTCR